MHEEIEVGKNTANALKYQYIFEYHYEIFISENKKSNCEINI